VASQQQPSSDASQAHSEFTRLFTLHQRPIYLYIRSLVANSADVDEIWQETNLVLWQRFADFQQGTNFLAWAQRIAHNKVLNYRTHRRPPVQFSDEFLDRLAASAEQASDRQETYLDAMNRCAEKLPSRDREIIQLRYGSRGTCQNVAETLGRSVHAIYKTLGRIRSQLLECMRREMAKEDRQ
jgi:RNA polymerase sigma-70 factor, ECF subfamily